MPLFLPAPAKLNLFLHITGRRADGYHQLQTLFQLLDYGDELEFDSAEELSMTLSPAAPQIPLADNLVWRAARALQQRTGCTLGAHILLHKRLPLGAGLGGGSSDAATTLVGLNRLWRLGLSRAELIDIGLPLGADVSLFLHGTSAWAEGIGERLTSVELPPAWYLVLAPDCQVSTAAIFGHRQLTRNAPPITIRAFLEPGGMGQSAINSCQGVVEALYPQVKAARQWLDHYAPARMTGTGACLFAKFDTEDQAQAVRAQIPDPWDGFIARGVNQSPLYQHE